MCQLVGAIHESPVAYTHIIGGFLFHLVNCQGTFAQHRCWLITRIYSTQSLCLAFPLDVFRVSAPCGFIVRAT